LTSGTLVYVLRVAEMLFLNSVTGITRRDKIKNDNIDNKLHAEILNDVIRCREKWKSYVQRMTGKRNSQTNGALATSRKRSRRRPRKG
jgi:hypothetical protein